ncbi:hypothetical protein [Actinokineospora pegani]|uniref:hypothetical protein n=1 Tax=Actinokineospora pegani TaxID=2654637 RepID=UPI0012EA6F6E|nr:hypothetical protein [Actinokineospora pegani]
MPEGNTPPAVPPITVGAQEAPGGHFAVTSLDELNSLLKRWQQVKDEIDAAGYRLEETQRLIDSPADDPASKNQLSASRTSLVRATEHNNQMLLMATRFVEALQSAREQYAGTEAGNNSAITQSGA